MEIQISIKINDLNYVSTKKRIKILVIIHYQQYF